MLKDHRVQVIRQLDRSAGSAMERLAGMLSQTVRSRIRKGYGTGIVDSGALERSITADWEKTSETRYAVHVGVPAGEEAAEYALYVHNGTYKMAGRPFLTDAVMEARTEIRGVLEEELSRGMGG